MKKQKKVMRKAKNMKRHIGIDLHTNSFTACILREGVDAESLTLLLESGMERFIKMLQPGDEVAVESTGNSRWFRERVQEHVGRVVVVAPSQFKVIRHSVKKTDKNDARAIATFLGAGLLPEARVKSRVQAELATAIKLHEQGTRQRVQCINTVHAMFNAHGIKIKKTSLGSKIGFERAVDSREWSRAEKVALEAIAIQLDALRKSQKLLNAEITAIAETLPGYENLISIKGIGALSAAAFLVEIGDIKDFAKAGNLVAYFGLTPRVSQSNDSQFVGRITKRGNKAIRTRLVQCALIAKKYSPYLQSFYERIRSKRGSGKAIIAVARKLLNTIFYTLAKGWVFEDFPGFEFKACN